MSRISAALVQRLWRLYKLTLSPLLRALGGGDCPYQPTCSEYAALAIAHHGWVRGSLLAGWRLLRCNPFSHGGFDPVPGTWPPASDTPKGRGYA